MNSCCVAMVSFRPGRPLLPPHHHASLSKKSPSDKRPKRCLVVYLGRRSGESSGCSRYGRGTMGLPRWDANRIGLAIFSWLSALLLSPGHYRRLLTQHFSDLTSGYIAGQRGRNTLFGTSYEIRKIAFSPPPRAE